MGKRKNQRIEESANDSEIDALIPKKKFQKKTSVEDKSLSNPSSGVEDEKKVTKKKKRKLDPIEKDITNETEIEESGQSTKKKKRKLLSSEPPPEKSKKKGFNEDKSLEVATNSEDTNTVMKKKKFLDEDEAAIKDEDIDQFCDELDEEDNKQYEHWIKLVEAKLHPNKNK